MKFAPAMVALAAALSLPGPALASGQQTFAAQCSMCHQPDGAGLPGSFPRLAGRIPAIARSPDSRHYPIMVLLYGLYGPITVDGKPINGLMPPMASLSDQAIADVLNHVLSLGKPTRKIAPFTAAEVAAVRSGGGKSGSEIASERARLSAAGLIP